MRILTEEQYSKIPVDHVTGGSFYDSSSAKTTAKQLAKENKDFEFEVIKVKDPVGDYYEILHKERKNIQASRNKIERY